MAKADKMAAVCEKIAAALNNAGIAAAPKIRSNETSVEHVVDVDGIVLTIEPDRYYGRAGSYRVRGRVDAPDGFRYHDRIVTVYAPSTKPALADGMEELVGAVRGLLRYRALLADEPRIAQAVDTALASANASKIDCQIQPARAHMVGDTRPASTYRGDVAMDPCTVTLNVSVPAERLEMVIGELTAAVQRINEAP